MLWTLRLERDGFSVDAARKKGRRLPDWFLNQPPEPPFAEFFYRAYRDLATCRPPDGPIPWRDAMAYADRKGLTAEAANVLWLVIRRMDQAAQRWHIENLKAGTGGG